MFKILILFKSFNIAPSLTINAHSDNYDREMNKRNLSFLLLFSKINVWQCDIFSWIV